MVAVLSRRHPARLLEAACNLTEFEDSPGPPTLLHLPGLLLHLRGLVMALLWASCCPL